MNRTMRAIVNTGPGRLELRALTVPDPGPGQVRIRTSACGICATDLEMIAGWSRTGFPAIPGHEWSGVVEAVGPGVDPRLIGLACVAENIREDGGEVGFEHPGGYAESFVTLAQNLHPIPPALPPEAAVLIEPLAVCVRGLRRLRVEDRRAALVFGDGPIGLLMLALLRREGVASLSLIGGRPFRLNLAATLFGASVLNYHEAGPDLPAALAKAFDGRFPNVIEATGSEAGVTAALDRVEARGKILIVGDYAGRRAGFAWNDLLHRELELIGSNASSGGWPEAVRVAEESAPLLHQLVTHRLPAERFAEGLELARHGRDTIKVALQWRTESGA